MRTCLIAVLLLAAAARADAQAPAVGVKAGVNYATVRFEIAEDTSARWLPVFGVFATFAPHRGVSLQPEVLYSVKGADLPGAGAPTTLRLDVVDIPVLARISVRRTGARVYAVAGPTVGVLVRAKTRIELSGVTEELDVTDDVERFDLGVTGGGGLEMGALVVDARYTFGLRDLDKDRTDAVRARTRTFTVTAGWRF